MFQVTDKIYQIAIAILIAAFLALGFKYYLVTLDIDSKQETIEKLENEKSGLISSVAIKEANRVSLSASLSVQSSRVRELEVKVAEAGKHYKIVERAVIKTIDREREVLRDINDSEDWNNTKRIIHEIITL